MMYEFMLQYASEPLQAKTYRGDFDFYSSVTSGRPAKLLRTDSTPASKEAESTTLQSTEESTADVPMVATAV